MSKLNIPVSIFSTMSQMAKQYNAVNLSQGFPDFPVDERLKESVAKWAKQEIHQYLPMAGLPSLLEKISALTHNSYGRKVNPLTDVLVTAGATQGIFAAIQAFVHQGEEVIILDPSYDCYETPVLLCNAIPVRINLNQDFTPDWNRIGNAMNAKTRMIITNNPHNPTGKMWAQDDFIQLEKLLDLYPDVIVLSDEVYEYITFENRHISANERPKLKEKSIVVSSFGKSFHVTGWKIGYLIAPEALIKEIKKVHQFLVFSVNSIAQYAINDYLDVVEISALGTFYKQKRDFFRKLLGETRFEILPCDGSYFQLVSYAAIATENDIDFTKRLVKEVGVATIPLSPFYAKGEQTRCIRFCFAKKETTLENAVERLMKL